MNRIERIERAKRLFRPVTPQWMAFSGCETEEDVDAVALRMQRRIADLTAEGIDPAVFAQEQQIVEAADRIREILKGER